MSGNIAYVEHTNGQTITPVALDDPRAPYIPRTLSGFPKACIAGTILYKYGRDSVSIIEAWDLGGIYVRAPTKFFEIPVRTVQINRTSCADNKLIIQWEDSTLSEYNTAPIVAAQPAPGAIPPPPPPTIPPVPTQPPVCQVPTQYGFVGRTNTIIIRLKYIGTATCYPALALRTSDLSAVNEAKNYAVEGYNNLLRIWRIDTPQPLLISELELTGFTYVAVKKVTLVGDMALVSGDRSYGWFVDVSNPLNPLVVGELPYPSNCGWCGTAEMIYTGNYTYKLWTESNNMIIVIYDTRNLNNIIQLQYRYWYEQDVKITQCCTQPKWSFFQTSATRLHWMGPGILYSFNIANPTNPVISRKTTFNTNPYIGYQQPYAYKLNGTILYLSSGNKIDILDMSDDTFPRFIGSADIPHFNADTHIQLGSTIITRDGRVYVANEEDYDGPLAVWPFVPTKLIDATQENIYTAVPDGVSAPWSRLVAHERNFNVNPPQLVSANANYRFEDMVQYADLVFTANGPDGIKKFRASSAAINSGTVTLVASRARHSTFDDPQSIDITSDGNLLVTAAGSDGFRLHSAATLDLLGTYSTPGSYVWNVRFLNDNVGVALFNNQKLVTLNVTNPANPTPIGEINVVGMRLQMGTNVAFVFDENSDTMDVINLANPAAPTFVRRIDRMRKSCINGTLLYRVIPDGIATVVAHDISDVLSVAPRPYDSIPVITPEVTVVSCSTTTVNRQDIVVQWFDGTISDHNIKSVIVAQFDVIRFTQTATKVFEYFNKLMTRDEAEVYCASRRVEGVYGRLASIRSQEENDVIKQFHLDNSSIQLYWIGLDHNTTQCTFEWADGLPYVSNPPQTGTGCFACAPGFYCNFVSSPAAANRFVAMIASGAWNTFGPNLKFQPICEWDKPVCAGNVNFDGIKYEYTPLPANVKICRPADGLCDREERCNGALVTCPTDFVAPTGTQCRGGNGVCDTPETCDGIQKGCPPDTLAPSTTICRLGGDCDETEYCTGNSSVCPVDLIRPAGFACRPKRGDCDVPEVCTGSSRTCPGDVLLSNAVLCRAKDGECDTAEYCNGYNFDCPTDVYQSGGVCRPSNGTCDKPETCSGTSAKCPPDVLQNPTFKCRDANGLCDSEEFCDGITATCPTDTFKPSTVACRAASDICDVDEFCSGTSRDCPVDGFKANTAICRIAPDPCDKEEYCSGTSRTCGPDTFLPAGTLCRATAGDCDVAEVCTGTASSCPANVFKSGSVCRNSTGDCDPAETCPGNAATCPSDVFSPASVVCRAKDGVCDIAEFCTGSSGQCPSDAVEPETRVCRSTSNGSQCDAQEFCDGSNKLCPDDGFLPNTTQCQSNAPAAASDGKESTSTKPTLSCSLGFYCTGSSDECSLVQVKAAGTLCREAVGDCDAPEYCDGVNAECPADAAVMAQGTVCRNSTGGCDEEEVCDGVSDACPTDAFNVGRECRPSGGGCDGAEFCDGTGPACPPAADNTAPAGTVCRNSTGPCDIEDVCDGTSPICPDNFEPSTKVCRDADGPCDATDFCAGDSGACPDLKQTSGFVCRDSTGICDPEDVCDGSTNTCSNVFAPATQVCRDAAGDCDADDFCSGDSGACPNVFKSSTTLCRGLTVASDNTTCDVEEYCTGSTASCPADLIAADGTVCRNLIGSCDTQVEKCSGASKACPAENAGSCIGTCSTTTGVCQSAICLCNQDFGWNIGGCLAPEGSKTKHATPAPAPVPNPVPPPPSPPAPVPAPSGYPTQGSWAIFVGSITRVGTSSTYDVCFGYDNPTNAAVQILQITTQQNPNGLNYLEPKGQYQNTVTTTTFQPGRHYCAFTVQTTSWVRWHVIMNGQEKQAHADKGAAPYSIIPNHHAFQQQGKSKSGSVSDVPTPPEVCTTDNKRVMIGQGNSKSKSASGSQSSSNGKGNANSDTKSNAKSGSASKSDKDSTNENKYSKNKNAWWKWFDELRGTQYANQWHDDCKKPLTCQKLVASCTNNCLGSIVCIESGSNSKSGSKSDDSKSGSKSDGSKSGSKSGSHSNDHKFNKQSGSNSKSEDICERLSGLPCIYTGETDDFRICSNVEDSS